MLELEPNVAAGKTKSTVLSFFRVKMTFIRTTKLI